MALLISPSRIVRTVATPQLPRPRQLPSRRGGARPDRDAKIPSLATRSEVEVSAHLIEEGIYYEYEPHEYALTLSGRGKHAFRPDFYLPALDLYIEVTEGNEYHVKKKVSKIRNLHETTHGNVRVLLIGPEELQQLRCRRTTVTRLLEQL